MALSFFIPHFLVSLVLLFGRKPLLPSTPPEAPLVVNTETGHICLEESPWCRRLDTPSVLKRAYLLYGDA